MNDEVIQTEAVPITQNEITQLADASGLEKTTAMMLKEEFSPLFDAADKWAKNARSIVVTDVTQTREMKLARESRLALRDIRLKAEKRKTILKADALSYGKAVQGMYNVILALVEPLERHLEEQENFAEVQAAKEKAEKLVVRRERMNPYFGYWDEDVDLSAFSDERFEKYVADAKECMEEDIRKAEAEAKRLKEAEEEAARLKAEAEKKEAEHLAELARLKAEQKKLDDERIAKETAERIAREKADAEEKEKREAEQKSLRDAADKARAEKEQAEAEARRIRAEAEQAERRRIEDERLNAEQIEKEIQAAQAKAEAEAIAEEKRIAEEKKKAASAPDKEKFVSWCENLLKIAQETMPTFNGPESESHSILCCKIVAAFKQYTGDKK